MARKKIIFVIVEGPSDDEALGVLLEKIFDSNRVFVYITHGDITTESGVTKNNILTKIGNAIKAYACSNHLTKTHFLKIIHILDMDGAYIPENAVVFDPHFQKPYYTENVIRTANVNGIRTRNHRKSEILDKISSTDTIWGIHYQAYYMSCNLDHVLYGKLNSSDEDKERDAHAFAKKYIHDIPAFKSFITSSTFSVRGNYRQSWKYIAENKHSLERHTNLGICLTYPRASPWDSREV